MAQNTTDMDGDFSLAVTSTVLANGGGVAISDEYVPVTEGAVAALRAAIKASAANVSSLIEVVWYTAAKALVSASTIYSSSSTPTTATLVDSGAVAPSTARFMRVRLTGGVPSTGAATGTIYFDGVRLGVEQAVIAGDLVTHAPPNEVSTTANSFLKVIEVFAPRTGTYRTRIGVRCGGSGFANARVYKNGVALGTSRSTITLAYYSEDLSFVRGDLIQVYAYATTLAETAYATLKLMEGNPLVAAMPYTTLE